MKPDDQSITSIRSDNLLAPWNMISSTSSQATESSSLTKEPAKTDITVAAPDAPVGDSALSDEDDNDTNVSAPNHFEEMQQRKQRKVEFSCDYCSDDVSFPIFNLLIVHVKNEHPGIY